MFLPNDCEIDGGRLGSLGREELMTLLEMRYKALVADEKAGHSCPENMKRPVADIVEVLNALAYQQEPCFTETFRLIFQPIGQREMYNVKKRAMR